MATNTSIYIDDELLARIDAECAATRRSRSNWFAVAAEAALRGGPVPPRVVREHDEQIRNRKAAIDDDEFEAAEDQKAWDARRWDS